MEWHGQVDLVSPHVVRIETPSGHGTGFLCMYSTNKRLCGVATAYHVVQDPDYWQQPIRICHDDSEKPRFLKEDERVIFGRAPNDSAVILFPKFDLNLPEEPIPLMPADRFLRIGVEAGWLGYPAVATRTLCFFSGAISARRGDSYFIDGVAINGVSGGPVFAHVTFDDDPTGKLRVIGVISAYYPNL